MISTENNDITVDKELKGTIVIGNQDVPCIFKVV